MGSKERKGLSVTQICGVKKMEFSSLSMNFEKACQMGLYMIAGVVFLFIVGLAFMLRKRKEPKTRNKMDLLMVLFIVCSLIGCGHIDPWTKGDTQRQIAITGLMAVDCYQTTQIRYHDDMVEMNPFMSDNPSDKEAITYFAVAYTLGTVTAYILPAKWRKYFQTGWILVEGIVVGRNFFCFELGG